MPNRKSEQVELDKGNIERALPERFCDEFSFGVYIPPFASNLNSCFTKSIWLGAKIWIRKWL